MAELPTERFKEAILKVVKLNERFILLMRRGLLFISVRY